MNNNEELELLSNLKNQIEESEKYFKQSKERAKRIKSYLKGDQLPEEVRQLLEEREQPEMWENIIKKIDKKISGLKITSKTQIEAIGRQQGSDKALANMLSDILKTVQDSTQWWSHKKRADLSLRVSGISIMEAVVKNTGEKDILGNPIREIKNYFIPAEQSFIDPFAVNPNYSDMRYFYRERYFIKDDLFKIFANEKVEKVKIFTQKSENEYSTYKEYMQDVSISKRVRVFEGYYKKWNFKEKRDSIYHVVWNENVILSHKKMPYEIKQFPISIRRLDEVDYDIPSDVRGMYYDLLPIQDRINNCHLRAIHMMGTNKLLFESDAVEDAETFVDEYSLDSAAVEVRPGAIVNGKIKDIKQYNEIASLKNEIIDLRRQAEEIIGMNNEVMGSAINRLSGAAIENRQNAGLVGLQDFIDTSNDIDRDLAEINLKLIQQYFNAEQVYAITNKTEADRYFLINEIEKDEKGAIIFDNGIARRKNKINIGRYDIILNTIPFNRGSSVERQKVWAEYIKALQVTHPHLVPQMIEASLLDTDSPIANLVSRIIEEDKKAQAQNGQEQQQAQMKQMELNMQTLQAKLEEIMSKANLNNAKAQEVANSQAS